MENKERETINIPELVMYKLITDNFLEKEEIDGWKVVERELTGSDMEDGGGRYDIIFSKDGRFWSGSYTEWDIDNTYFDEETEEFGRNDFNTELVEVFPKKIKKTVYN